MDDRGAKRHQVRTALFTDSFNHHPDLRLKLWSIAQDEIGALQTEIADGGLFLENSAIFCLSADYRVEAQSAARCQPTLT